MKKYSNSFLFIILIIFLTINAVNSVESATRKTSHEFSWKKLPNNNLSSNNNNSDNDPPIKSERLLDDISPIFYNLSFFTDLDIIRLSNYGYFIGNLSILLKVNRPTNMILLNCAMNIELDKILLYNNNIMENSKGVLIDFTFIRYSNDLLIITLENQLKKDQLYTLSFVNFNSSYEVDKESGWLIRLYSNQETGRYDYMLSTQMQPQSARQVFPCFDEPKFKSEYQLKMTTNIRYNMIFNMPALSCATFTDSFNQSWKSCWFKKSVKMTTYNVAMALVPFGYIEKIDEKNRTFRIWGRKSEIERAEFALNITVEAFKLYEEEFGIEFPLEKVDSLAIPNLNGFLGMEHYGLITYDEPVLIYSDSRPFMFSKYVCVLIISHEVAHQWFGNLVTTDWWEDLWLNEGFTTFYSYKIASKLIDLPQFYEEERFKMVHYVREMDDNFNIRRESVRTPVYLQSENKFNYLAYKKGFLICDMMERILGKENFKKAMIDYLTRNSYTSVNTTILWQSVDKYYNKFNLKKYINEWLNKNGYPVIKIAKLTNTSISISQSSSIVYSNKDKSYASELWNIFVNYKLTVRSNISKINIAKFSNKYHEININSSIPKHWLLVNSDIASFLVVNYDEFYFQQLIIQFHHDHTVIPKLSRVQIMFDYYHMSNKFNHRNLVKLLELMTYLRKETDEFVIYSAIQLLDKLNAFFQYHYFYVDWNNYVQSILEPSFNNLLYDFLTNFTSKSSTKVNWRINLLYMACRLNLKDVCDTISKTLVERWKSNTMLVTDYDLLHLALCREIELDRSGRLWMEIFNNTMFNTWDYMNVKYYAMGCSRVTWIVDKMYGFMIYNDYKYDYAHYIQFNERKQKLPDDLEGLTPVTVILLISMSINNPNLLSVSLRFQKNPAAYLYNFLVHRPYFPISNSLIEYLYPTMSHHDFALKSFQANVFLRISKINIKWIANNCDEINRYFKRYNQVQ